MRLAKVDVANPDSCRALAARLRTLHPLGIDVLVNNAAVRGVGPRETIATNVYGVLEMSGNLAPLLAKRAGRIINVGSRGHKQWMWNHASQVAMLDPLLTEVELVESCEGFIEEAQSEAKSREQNEAKSREQNEAKSRVKLETTAYKFSKAALHAATRVLARRHRELWITCVCPGHCKTDLAGWERPPSSAADGAKTVAWLASRESKTRTTLKGEASFFAEKKRLAWAALNVGLKGVGSALNV